MCEKCGNYIKLRDFEKHKEEGCFDLLIFDTKEKFYIKNKNNYEPFDEKENKKKEEEIFKKIENNFKEIKNNILLSIQNNNQRINNNNIYNKKNVIYNNNNNELKSNRNKSKNSKNNYIYLGDLNDIILKEKVKKIKKFEQEIKKLKRDLTCSKFIEYFNNDKNDFNNDFMLNNNYYYEDKKIYRKTNSTKFISNYKNNEYNNKIKENKKNLLKINFNRSNEKKYNYNYYYNNNNNEFLNNRYLNYIEKTKKNNNIHTNYNNNNNIYKNNNNNNNKYSFNESLIKAIKHNFMN